MPASDLTLEQILDVRLHCDFPGVIDLLVEKSAAAACDLRQAFSSFYTKSDISVYWNPAQEKAGMYIRPQYNEEEFEQGKLLLAEKVGAEHVHPEPLTGYDLQDWWVKVAYSPFLRRVGEVLQFFPSKDIPGYGGRPIASAVASGLLGAGLGYGTGFLTEQMLPPWAKTKGTLRKRLALTGPVDESIRVSKNQSYAIRIATDFEIPGRCFELFVFLWLRSLIRAINCAE